MLRELTVRNLALIDEARIVFEPGLTCLTGETGAGKSVLLDALGLAIGRRASPDLVRTGAAYASVDVVFDVADCPAAQALLAEAGLWDDDGVAILTREVGPGRRVARVNGRPVTTAFLRRLGDSLVRIHAQHAAQTLLRPEAHRDLLDAFGGETLAAARAECAEAVRAWREAEEAWRRLTGQERERLARIDLLTFQVAEIDAAALRPGERAELEVRRRVLQNMARLQAGAAEVLAALRGEAGRGEAGGAADLASRAAARLRELAALDDRLEPLAGSVQSAAYELEEAARQLRLYAEGLDLEPGELDQVEERLAVLGRLCRKYGADEAAVLAYRQRAAAELDQLSRADAMAAALEGELEVRRRRAEEACDRLTALRRQAALQLEAAMAAELPALGLSGAAFAAAVEAVDNGFSAGGRDRVRFLVSMNRGEPLQPLQRVASGGELARVMLGLGNVLAGVDPVATIVFDEVESGLGGQAAVAVAERLVRLARHHQVLCVSHLPQVAARCRHHLLAEKEETGGRIRTRFRVLTGEERVAELARMLSGDAGPLALEHARQLLRQAASH